MAYLKITDEARVFLTQKDPYMHTLINHVKEPKEPQFKEPFLALVDQIVGQQISEHVKELLMMRLKKHVKTIDPKTMKSLDVETLRKLGLSKMKAQTIKRLSEATIDFESLPKKTDQVIYDTLINIKGIGLWTIEMFLFVACHRKDIFSLKDKGIENALLSVYPIDKQDLAKFKDYFSPYGSYAQAYLWQYLKEDKTTQEKIKKECAKHEHPFVSK